ncbi:MAG: LytTR family DNA-binding domain-containing protein [Prevotellaceae bacterium]|jgi:DNA-binding LytR/AlgR family response regulator|nr:LytTR family DNA-binding domain-containing protein [Prevotellaceae bacterium]
MKCIAIDDEPLALKLLAGYCSRVPSIRLLGAYTDPLDGISYIRSMKPDLIFLDIRMPDISGINIAQDLDKDTLIIFTTAHREYAVEGFELDVVDYLLKPFGFERFLKAYAKAEERFTALQKPDLRHAGDDKTVSFKYNYQRIRLPLHSILYIEADNDYIKIVTPDKTYTPRMSLRAMESLLSASGFIRVHKSFIVDVGKIKSFSKEKIITDRKQIPLGRSYCKEFLDKMASAKQDIAATPSSEPKNPAAT